VIENVDARLRDWVSGVAGQQEISLGPPVAGRPGSGVSLYLMGVRPRPPMRGTERPPVQVELRYLVTTWSDKPEQAHSLLGQLVLAAMRDADLDVDGEPLPPGAWASFQLAPQPSFTLVALLRDEPPASTAKLVTRSLRIDGAGLTRLDGTVLGPGDVPVAAASVELPALQLTVQTDGRGRFVFARLPAQPSVKHLVVRARGRQLAVDADLAAAAPLVIRIPMEA
jgi:hypothetical protein